MKNFTLNTASLLIISLFSAQAFANSPWAEETQTNETSVNESDPQTEQTTEPMRAQNEAPVPESIDADIAVEPVAVEVQQSAPQPVATTAVTQGDVLNNTVNNTNMQVLNFPRRGMTSDKVQNELGQPAEIIPSVGQPPISRWVYDDRTVYFEYSSVIHVVAK